MGGLDQITRRPFTSKEAHKNDPLVIIGDRFLVSTTEWGSIYAVLILESETPQKIVHCHASST